MVLRLNEMDNRLDELEVVDEIRSISDIEPRDEVGVMVAEFLIVSDTELDPDEESTKEIPEVSELLEIPVIESRVPGQAEKKDDKDELDMLLKGVVCVVVGRV